MCLISTENQMHSGKTPGSTCVHLQRCLQRTLEGASEDQSSSVSSAIYQLCDLVQNI